MGAEQPFNMKAAAWTTGVHILLFLLFIFISYTTPASAPVEELGMEVNLGTGDYGGGDDQPMAVDAPAPDAVTARARAHAARGADSRQIMESDDPDAPAVSANNPGNTSRLDNRTERNVRNRNESDQPTNNAAQQQRPRYVYEGSNGPGGNNAVTNRAGTNEGDRTGAGDRGVPGGIPGSPNYTGSPGNGTGGISHTLSGRDISPRQFVAEFNEGGKVIVRVKVDRDGNIISRSIRSSSNRKLSEIALQKLAQARFSKSPDAAPEQIGDITFIFKTRPQ